MLPIRPDWHRIIMRLHKRYGSWKALIEALNEQGCETQYSVLWRLCSHRGANPSWPTGAALMNLHWLTGADVNQ